MCSIEFDRDCDYFAIAGVTKKIKVIDSVVMLLSFTSPVVCVCVGVCVCVCYSNYPRRARSALGVDTVLTLDVCMFVCLYVCLYVC